MTAALLAAAAVIVLDVYAVVLVVLRAKIYRVAVYRPMLLNIGLSTLPVVTAIGVVVGLTVLAPVLTRLADVAPDAGVVVLPIYLALATGVWLLLFPNSVYLITELNFSHRTADSPVPLWYDIIQTLVLTLSGLGNAVLSLGILHALFVVYEEPDDAVPPTASWVLAAVVIVLGAVGVYLGRYLRVNSWDVRHPVSLLRKLVAHLRQPGKALEASAFVVTHALLVAVLYVPLFSLTWTSFVATAV
ncbi:hypothetical protein CSIV_10710 [Microbacterium sp. CSI-V]|uniref:DUF1361 domain-containing protein n=1 Tax=unclassified Microbacterium TaxID=2609290 RepID=UPI00097BD7BD|nr:DUF1361 domain-containing protein [Microbacterium sp. CSI-V]MXS73349.1 DUF1361 domain-containing protein [Microbacterium sp. TL13]ONI62015.1 hypothetical protein CSIV_10710 [Microbacterium sp. CSI-V]